MPSLSSPSKIWDSWLSQIGFLREVSPSYLRFLVGFGYYLGSPIEKDIWRVNRYNEGNDESRAITDYHEIIEDDVSFLLSEQDPRRSEFSLKARFRNNDIWINSDVLRMQVEAANIQRFGLDNVNTICEIGGGYGQLALGFLLNRPQISYTIVDFPQILDVVKRWISYLDLGINVQLYDSLNEYDTSRSNPGLHLFPNNLLCSSSILNYDLGININSFCEMRTSQISHYMKLIKTTVFYSNNRDRQPNNHELKNLSDLFSELFDHIHPDPKAYLDNDYKKRVFIMGDLSRTTQIHIDKICGIRGLSMPGLLT